VSLAVARVQGARAVMTGGPRVTRAVGEAPIGPE